MMGFSSVIFFTRRLLSFFCPQMTQIDADYFYFFLRKSLGVNSGQFCGLTQNVLFYLRLSASSAGLCFFDPWDFGGALLV